MRGCSAATAASEGGRGSAPWAIQAGRSGKPTTDRALGWAIAVAVTGGTAVLGGCGGDWPRPMAGLNRQLEQLAPAREPVLSGPWLAMIGQRNNRDHPVLIDLEHGRPVPLPGLDRPDAQPLAIAVDGAGERLALVRLRENQTELVIYRRSLQTTQTLPMLPAGVPRRISLQADGRQLAVEVSRDGRWQMDLINLP